MFVALFGITTMAIAAEGNGSVAQVSSEEVYLGLFKNITMNGTAKDSVEDKTTSVIVSNNVISSLKSESFRVGKMPGTITISASNLSVSSTGTFSGTCTVTLKIVSGTDYSGTISGTLKDGKLVYNVVCNASWLGVSFDTDVTFEGEVI